MDINIQGLVSDAQCYEVVRDLRWPEKIICAHCDSNEIIVTLHGFKRLVEWPYLFFLFLATMMADQFLKQNR